jgi:superfamily II DNA or RNA helicase
MGRSIRFEDLRDRVLPEPAYQNLKPLRGAQPDIVAALIASDCGVIEAPTASGKSFVIRMLCVLYPGVNIIICTPFTSLLRGMYAELKEILTPNELGLVGDGSKELGRRVTLVTDRSLIKCDLEKCRIFIFDEVHRAASREASKVISKIRNARMFGFSASPYGRSDHADLETEAMFGPRICRITYQEAQENGSVAPVNVLIYSCDGIHPVDYENPNALERHGMWRNAGRNALIAKAVADAKGKLGEDAQIMVSVKTVEHAVFLRRYLPDFEMVYASMKKERMDRWINAGLLPKDYKPLDSEAREDLRKRFASGELRRVIATGTWSTGVDFPKLDVLIRADGLPGVIPSTQIPGRVTRTADNKEAGYVVDFDDSFNGTFNSRALRRLAVYKKKGWNLQWVLKT